MNQYCKRSELVITSGRQRQEFDPQAMEDLRASIETNGLLHAPVVRELNGSLVLVAGETRIKIIDDMRLLGTELRYNNQVVPEDMIPYVTLGELSPLEAEEAELDENLRRKDLTWQEHAAAVAKLHNLRVAQQQDRVETAAANGQVLPPEALRPHTVADTALELSGRKDGSFQDAVRKEILVSRHLSNPEVAKAKSSEEAFKILKRQEETAKNVELALTVGATFSSSNHTLLNGDCLAELADPKWLGVFDVICTDPPYGMGAESFGDAGGKMTGIEHHYDDSLASWRTLMRQWVPLTFAVTKPQAHLYAFCDFDNFHELKALLQAVGWYVFRTPLILHKVGSGRVPLPDQGPRRQYETILYAIKGKKPITHIYPDVLSVSGDENLGHGAQKPVAAIANLLQRSVRPGDKVLDSFCGTGPIFEAANGFQCEAVGIEFAPEYYALSLKRLQSMKAMETPGMF